MSSEISDGRVLLKRDERQRQPLLTRLRRIEGQVRGIAEMIEQDRYCGDELLQLNAAIAALREVAIMLATEHVTAAAGEAIASGEREVALQDVATVLRAAMRIV